MSWRFVPLSEALSDAPVFVDGDWVESKDQDPDGDVRLVQLADVGDGFFIDKSSRFLTSDKARKLRCTYLEAGDVLVARMPDPLGRACIFPGLTHKCVTVVDVCIIRPNSNRVDTRYLMHCINGPSVRSSIHRQATGTTRQRISRGNLKKVTIPLPPLEEQRRIAAILDKAEELRAKRRAAIALLDQLPQAIFLEMFGDPAVNPNGWPVVRIGDLLESASYGSSGKAGSVGAWPILRMGNLTVEGHLDLADLKYIDLDQNEIPKYTVEKGDILFNRTNSSDLVGKTALYNRDEPAAFAGYLVRLRVNDKANPEFVAAFMNLGYTKKVLRSMAKSIVGMANINAKEVQTIAIPQPPIALQTRFAERVKVIRDAKTTHQSALTELDALFVSLQYRAFSNHSAGLVTEGASR